MNVIYSNKEDGDNMEEDMSDKSYINKVFNTILKDIKNNGKTTKSANLKIWGNKINLNPVIIKVSRCRKSGTYF